MKKSLFIAAAFAALLVAAASCNKSDSGTMVEAVATIKDATSGYCYFQLDDNTILQPRTSTANPYGGQMRVHMVYIDYGKAEKTDIATSCEVRAVDLSGISKILTKKAMPSLGLLDPVTYGNDPMDIVNTWGTVVEDGYMTICFRSLWGLSDKPHTINLVRNVDSKDPYLFELRQNYNGDEPSGLVHYGIVAFDISDIISDQSKTYDIKVRHIGTDGETRTASFTYKFGTSAHLNTNDNSESNLTLDAEIE